MAHHRKIRWNEFLMDKDGEFSFKRLVPAICIVLFTIYFTVNLTTGRILDPNALDLIMWVIIASTAAQAVEPFSRFRKTTIVSKDAVVTQEANPISSETAVNKAVEKIVGNSTPPPTLPKDVEKIEEKPKNQETMPEFLE